MNINVTREGGRGEKLKGSKVYTREKYLKRNMWLLPTSWIYVYV